jgi:hypothetical protein
MRPLRYLFGELCIILVLVFLLFWSDQLRQFFVYYILCLGIFYLPWPIKNQNIDLTDIKPNTYQFYLVTEKRIQSMGHSFVVLVDNNRTQPYYIIAYYPVEGVAINKEHDVKIFTNLIDGTSNNTTYKSWNIDSKTYKLATDSLSKYRKRYVVDIISQLIPIPFNSTYILCNCSTFAAAFTNEFMNTDLHGHSPIALAKQIEKMK